MNEPPSPPIRPRATFRDSNLGTFLAVTALLLLAGGMIALLGIVTGSGFLMIPVIIMGTVLAGIFHYFLWGRVLTKLLTKAEKQDQDPEA